MLHSLVVESLTKIHFSVERPERVADVVEELVDAAASAEVHRTLAEAGVEYANDRVASSTAEPSSSRKKTASINKR